jgi:hypothetical protein
MPSKLVQALEIVANRELNGFMKSLYVNLGNKRYLHDIEKALERLELTAEEKYSFRLLGNDIDDLGRRANDGGKKFRGY